MSSTDLTPRTARPARVVVPAQVLGVLVVFAAAGALCGWLWHRLWSTPSGVVSDGQWYTDEHGLRDDFAGTGWYVVVALAAGLVLGVVCAWVCERSELATLAAVLVGSVLAGYLMYRVGTSLGPPDPAVAARTAADGTRLDGDLRVHGLAPRGSFPLAALCGLIAVYFTTGRRGSGDDRRLDGAGGAGADHGFADGTAG